MKLLIIDDEPEILKKISILAESNGHSVKSATSVESLQHILKAKSFYPHVIILDRILNGVDSISLIPNLKTAFADSRLLIVSAIDTASEKALALDAGADDYLAKPFSAVELLARINALTRRKSLYDERATLQVGNLILNKEERLAKVQSTSLALSQKEFQLLYMFSSNPGKIFPREILLEEIWQSSSEIESKVVEATINNLRRKLEASSASVAIKNMRNVGYWLET
ncbi:response regulator transcription factor [Bdellovibrio sp. HCB-162]|uniref:response regulator transcription factor n=1 Tax=Bdellovibrio sp. HCB-162 TaxID=3394234 RepID=UPI0039BC32AC